MSKLRVVLGINSLTESQWPAYNTQMQLMNRLGRSHPDMDLLFVNPSRTGIDSMRNTAATLCVKGKFDYVLFVDDDVLPPPDTLARLIACDSDIAAGSVVIRGYPFDYMCFRYTEDKKNMRALAEYDKLSGPIQGMDAVGFSCCLIKRELIEKVEPPYFITGVNHTEDVYFCIKARKAFPHCTIVVDTQLVCGHILWPEVISSENRDLYKDYYEKLHPSTTSLPSGTNLKIVDGSRLSYEKVMQKEMEARGCNV